MAKRRLAEHFRENRLGLLRQCGFKSATRPRYRFLRSFGVVWRQPQVRLLTPKALMYLRKYLRLNQTIGSRGICATLQTYCSVTEEEWKVERRRPSRGRT